MQTELNVNDIIGELPIEHVPEEGNRDRHRPNEPFWNRIINSIVALA